MSQVVKMLKPAVICFVIMTLICGVIYPGIVTGIAQEVFPAQANGSIIKASLKDGADKEYGSALIGQEFTKPEYMIGRPMGATNLSPFSTEQKKLVRERVQKLHSLDPDNTLKIPADLVTGSGSGVDPNISPEAAEYQVTRIAKARGISEASVRKMIGGCTKGRFLGFWGEPSVNVLKVNIMLDEK